MGTIYIAAFIVACASSFTATPFAIWLSKRCGVLDYPNSRKVHQTPIPRWGGLGIYLGIIWGFSGSTSVSRAFANSSPIAIPSTATGKC